MKVNIGVWLDSARVSWFASSVMLSLGFAWIVRSLGLVVPSAQPIAPTKLPQTDGGLPKVLLDEMIPQLLETFISSLHWSTFQVHHIPLRKRGRISDSFHYDHYCVVH